MSADPRHPSLSPHERIAVRIAEEAAQEAVSPVQAIAEKAARAAQHAFDAAGEGREEAKRAYQKAEEAYAEAKRNGREVKRLAALQKTLAADQADANAALMIGLHTIAQTTAQQAALEVKVVEAKTKADMARADALEAQDKAEEITGQYNLQELARQSMHEEDSKLIRHIAKTAVDGTEEARKLRNATLWAITKKVAFVVAACAGAAASAYFASGLHH